jgi:hypothetical protein
MEDTAHGVGKMLGISVADASLRGITSMIHFMTLACENAEPLRNFDATIEQRKSGDLNAHRLYAITLDLNSLTYKMFTTYYSRRMFK